MSKKVKSVKVKTYVITMMVKFPRQGIVVPSPTGFKKKILTGEKKHTIRQNYHFWKKRIDEINAGKAILSVRQWTGKPYNSEQKEIKQFKQGEVGYQRVTIEQKPVGKFSDYTVLLSVGVLDPGQKRVTGDGYKYLSGKKIKQLAENDGITIEQMQKFFNKGVLDGIIIHFSDLRY
jgi:hypothetical protein